jgi:CrcB protein
MKALLLVFLGGGFGSLLRYGLSLWLGSFSQKFPFATLITNIISCVLLGILIGWSGKQLLSDEMKLLLMVGLCGGFSTFSTFSGESYMLLNGTNPMTGILYMAASFLICLVAIHAGLKIAS